MARQKRNVSLADETLLALNVPPGGNLSGRINTVVQRYAEIVSRSMPTLAKREWLAIADCADGRDDRLTLPAILGALLHAPRDIGGQGVDVDALVAKLRAMSAAQSAAVIEAVELYGRYREEGLDAEESLAKAGVETEP